MKIAYFLLVVCALVSFESVGAAATLQAKVTEVHSGNTLAVTNIKRTLKIRLRGIAPPEAGQPFSEAAREHLKVLVWDKTVVVDYANLSEGYLDAKIILNGIDVGSQMIRDGVAWYDRSIKYGLSAAERELYASCEQAARDEKRGLWSDSNPVAPWEFRKAKEAPAKPAEPVGFPAYRESAKSASSDRALSNRYLGRGNVEAGAIAGNPNIRQLSPNAEPDEWINYRSETPRFSIRVPGNSYLFQYPVLDSQLKIVNMSYVVGNSDGSLYTVMWTKGSNDNLTDTTVADSLVAGLIGGINHYAKAKGLDWTASFGSGRAVRLGSYAGRQYPVSAGRLSGFARIVSRQVGDQREIFALAVFCAPGDESSFDFLNSLKIADARK